MVFACSHNLGAGFLFMIDEMKESEKRILVTLCYDFIKKILRQFLISPDFVTQKNTYFITD